jgi:hypothetical protein
MDYYSFTSPLELDSLAVDYRPEPELANTIITWWMHVTGESGATYNLIRAVGMPRKDLVLSFGAFRGSDDIDERAEHFCSQEELPVVEPFWTARIPEAVIYGSPSFEIEMRQDRYVWRDAGGRIDLTAERLGQVCAFWAPPQPGVPDGFQDRSHLCKVSGTVDGEQVQGMFMDDHVFSRPGALLKDSGLVTVFENFWMQWLVEYEDGTLEGGSAWRGQPGSGFSHAHHYVDGVSRARRDGRIDVSSNDQGSMDRMTLTFPDVTFDFEQLGAYDWPLHSYGRVATSSREKQIARSWHYTENWPVNMHAIESYQEAYHRLYGRPCSLKQLLAGARIVDEALVLTPPTAAPVLPA